MPEAGREAMKKIFITGMTASGKSDIAIKACEKLGNAEIISVDSMKIYRGMDIGTAKPSETILKKIRHHIIDIVDPSEEYSAGRFVSDADSAFADITKRGGVPVFEGGTALYLKALVEGLFSGPPANAELRLEFEAQAAKYGTMHLHNRLKAVDPVAALRLHPNDKRRIIRALEVYEITRTPISQYQTQFGRKPSESDYVIIGIQRERACIYERINNRVDWMFKHGLVDETKGLLKKYGRLGKAASQALGYKEVIEYLDNRTGLEEAVELVKQKTRNFAKHQLTWFKRFQEIKWVSVEENEDLNLTCEKIIGILSKSALLI